MRTSSRIDAVQSPVIPIVGDLVRSTPGCISLGQGVVYYGPPPEALEAARQSHTAAVEENRLAAGESWEQTLALASRYAGEPVEASASVVWRDTSLRSILQVAQALGTLVEKLGVPPKALWSRIPGVTQHELDQWKAMADEPGAFDDLMAMLEKSSTPPGGNGPHA